MIRNDKVEFIVRTDNGISGPIFMWTIDYSLIKGFYGLVM